MNSVKILVVIATYNRPNSFLAALRSIDNQDYENFSILISDNSTNADTERIMEDVIMKHRFRYIHRDPQPNGIDHFNLILKEMPADYDYFMICHDDDTLREGAISSVARLAEQYPSCVAICSNGYKVRENGKIIGKFVKPDGNRVISSQKELAEKYLKEKGLPFPAILYKMITSTVPFDMSKGGKHCDTAHTIDLLGLGSIFWGTNSYIINYTIGENQDSHFFDPIHRRWLLQYIVTNVGLSKSDTLVWNYRLNDIYMYYCLNHKKIGSRILYLLFFYRQYKLFFKGLLKKVL